MSKKKLKEPQVVIGKIPSTSLLNSNTTTNVKALDVKLQVTIDTLQEQIVETKKIQQEYVKLKISRIQRPSNVMQRERQVTAAVDELIVKNKLKHKCDIALLFLERFRQLDKEKKPNSRVYTTDLKMPFGYELASFFSRLNVRPQEAVRYICEGMTKTQARKLKHWTERTQSLDNFSNPETIAIIELVDLYDKQLKDNPKLTMKEFYRAGYQTWFKKFMPNQKDGSYNSFVEWFKLARRRTITIKSIHKDMVKFKEELKVQELGKAIRVKGLLND